MYENVDPVSEIKKACFSEIKKYILISLLAVNTYTVDMYVDNKQYRCISL